MDIDLTDGDVLVVANRTLRGVGIEEALVRRHRAGPVRFHLVVPATPADDQVKGLLAAEHLVASGGEDGGFVIARRRLAHAERRWRALGLEITGEVGDPDPYVAVIDACRGRTVREVIVSTLARGRSGWLRDGLPRKLRRYHEVPVEVVESTPAEWPRLVGH